jgi:hypothetical protein
LHGRCTRPKDAFVQSAGTRAKGGRSVDEDDRGSVKLFVSDPS